MDDKRMRDSKHNIGFDITEVLKCYPCGVKGGCDWPCFALRDPRLEAGCLLRKCLGPVRTARHAVSPVLTTGKDRCGRPLFIKLYGSMDVRPLPDRIPHPGHHTHHITP